MVGTELLHLFRKSYFHWLINNHYDFFESFERNCGREGSGDHDLSSDPKKFWKFRSVKTS